MTRAFAVFTVCVSVLCLNLSAYAAPPASYDPNQSWESVLSGIKEIQKGFSSAEDLNKKLFEPAMQENRTFKTIDGSREFSASFLCQGEEEVVNVTTSLASNGELNITIAYDLLGNGTLGSNLTITNVAGVCTNGAVYDCQPSGSWTGCKYGLIEIKNGTLVISPEYESGEPRPALGMTGCFCFSNACGGTADMYKQNILSHIGQGVANLIAAKRGNLVLSGPEYTDNYTKASWYSGDVDTCNSESIATLTSQMGKLELDYKSVVDAQEADSPWDLLTKGLERTATQFVCKQNAKATSEWGLVERIQKNSRFGIGHDTNGSSTQCFWFSTGGGCGSYFGEPGDWAGCMAQFEANKARVCYEMWVSGGYFTSITNVANAKPVTGVLGVDVLNGECYGADGNDNAQLWEMDCYGKTYGDKYVCYSSDKSKKGTIIYNTPYNALAYEGCDEVRPIEDNCTNLASRDDCRIVKEVTDGVITISNGTVTTARPTVSCKTIQGVKSSIVVCEPWWEKTRTYECSDLADGWEKEKERAAYIADHTEIDSNNYLSSIGDLTFAKDGTSSTQVIDVNIQFEKQSQACIPACVVQKSVPNYQLIVPSGQGKVEEDGSYHVEETEYSVVPSGTQTIIETVDCEFANDMYTCPIPEGWAMRAQCSCADGREFIQAISALAVINEISKDFICSTGQEAGVCSVEEETGVYVNEPICGIYSSTNGALVEGEDYSLCSPRLWTGKAPTGHSHEVYINDDYSCMSTVPGLIAAAYTDSGIKIGTVQVQNGWFAPVVEWAKAKAIEYVSNDRSSWLTSSGCECGSLDTDEIPVCQTVSGGSTVTCLSSGASYTDLASCQAVCQGRATQGPEQICIWQDSLRTGDIPVDFNIGLYPGKIAVFGEVYLNAFFKPAVEAVITLPECIDESVNETADPFYESQSCSLVQTTKTFRQRFGLGWDSDGSSRDCYSITANGQCGTNYFTTKDWSYCQSYVRSAQVNAICPQFVSNGSLSRLTSSTYEHVSGPGNYVSCWGSDNDSYDIYYNAVCTGQKDEYVCGVNGNSYTTNTQCASSCQKLRYRCQPSGRVVDNPAQCYTPKFRCSDTNTIFTSHAFCEASCTYLSVSGGTVCNGSNSQESFVLYLKESNGPYGFDMVLERLTASFRFSPYGTNIVAEESYGHTDLIVSQCVQQYMTPYIKFDEPSTNAHFEFSPMDSLVYYMGIQQGILPHNGSGKLPEIPSVYMGLLQRQYQAKLNELWEDVVADDGTISKVLNQRLTEEQRKAIMATLSTYDETKLVPRQPMFLTKTVTSQGHDSSRGGRAGVFPIMASNLISSVYYYECPFGVTNHTEQCGQISPFGGIAQTIQGKKCFQFFCDDSAEIETTSNQYSGCGLINDGMITTGQ